MLCSFNFSLDTIFDAQIVCISPSSLSDTTTTSKSLSDAATVLEVLPNADTSNACLQPGKFYSISTKYYSNTFIKSSINYHSFHQKLQI